MTKNNKFTKSKAIQLDDVSVRYRMIRDRATTFKEFALRWIKGQQKISDFWALRNIELQVEQGESIGIIGANGAGKSTLLKVISRVLSPITGRVRLRGDIAPILSLGAGFDLEMTGRENFYLNGAMLGFSRATMDSKFERLLEFSGLEQFIDSPLRTYSDGMAARLAFAIATDVEVDIILIDEVLNVGDKDFHKKCIKRINKFVSSGKTVVIVSHNLNTIQELCNRVIWLDYGKIRADGKPEEVIPIYQKEPVHSIVEINQISHE